MRRDFRCLFARDDDLDAYARRVLPALAEARPGRVERFDAALCRVLLREPPFQVESVTLAPGLRVPPHHHRLADTIEVFIAGSLRAFSIGGRAILPDCGPDQFARRVPGFAVRIQAGTVHGATAGPDGAIFLSVQRWRDGKPRPIGDDWIGEAVGPLHRRRLINADPC